MIELTDVRALTLLNPWAHLIANGPKRIENRSWMPWESIDRLYIHAGRGWDEGATAWVHERFGIEADDVQASAVVAVADVGHACNASRWADRLICGCGPWAVPGQCHWRLGQVWTLPKPVPCRGRQGLWLPPEEVQVEVAEQIRKVRATC